VDNGKWTARFDPVRSNKYIHELKKQDEFPHCIWPEHCIIGTEGAAVMPVLMDAIMEWSRQGINMGSYGTFTKGAYPFSEHFGAFRANVPTSDIPSTQLNQELITTLNNFQTIYFAGEAKSHCVANTLKQAMDFPNLAQKFIILEDGMSPVTGFEQMGQPIYDAAKKMGIVFDKTTNITL
jgi:nicotinamidase-related amidase